VVVVGVVVLALCTPGATATGASPAPDLSDLSCVVPALPHGVAAAWRGTDRLLRPVVTALTGGAARHGFTLDDRDLVVTAPRAGDVPVLTADQAICGAMASTAGLSSSVEQGVAYGYGRVSVAKKRMPAITGFPYSGYVAPQNPTVQSFSDRLAWLVVVHTNPAGYFCADDATSARPVRPRASDHGYEVFMIDARTGTDAVV
jgi:hypothetical protein